MRSFIIAILTLAVSIPAYAKYGGGTGEPNDPYQIATAADLIALGETPEDYDKHFIMTVDIDLGGHVFDKAVIAPDTDPSDTYSQFQGTAFTSVFDGNGHRISHLTIQGQTYLGLFGYLGSGAQVKDLGIVDVSITGSGDCVGVLVGFNGGGASHCYSTGAVSGNNWVGGLVGYNGYGTVTDSYSTGTLTGKSQVGGLVGYNSHGAVLRCYSSSAVTATSSVGGLIGQNGDGHLPYNLISGRTYYGRVYACHSSGAVIGTDYVGGLVGSNAYSGTISNCYSNGSVSGDKGVGGLVGCNGRTISLCYSIGSVNGTEDVGGLVGRGAWLNVVEEELLYGAATGCFWDMETSGQATSDGGTGTTTAQMQDPNTFMPAGWDFVGETANGTENIWAEPTGGRYPLLSWQLPRGVGLPDFSGGTGEPNDPYRITTPAELNSIADSLRLTAAHFELANDIDMTGVDFNVIGSESCPFTGSFSGDGHTVSHLTVKGENSLGMFARLGSGAVLKHLGVVDVNISGSGSRIGGLVGENHGSVTQCYSTGAVSGSYCVGGVVGNNEDGIVTQCYSTSSVGGGGVGGLVGCNMTGIVTECYSTGSSAWRGLVGFNAGRVTASFWDTQASGQTDSGGGTGKTTAEMQIQSTFTDAGWDFVNVWGIGENQTYPYLRKHSAADINQDGSVNFLDLAALAENWLTAISP